MKEKQEPDYIHYNKYDTIRVPSVQQLHEIYSRAGERMKDYHAQCAERDKKEEKQKRISIVWQIVTVWILSMLFAFFCL